MRNSPAFSFTAVGAIVCCWLICAVAQIEKYLALPKALLVTAALGFAIALGVAAAVSWLHRKGDTGMWPLLLIFALTTIAFAAAYPRSLHPKPGKGSDREDALRVELLSVTHHRYPYAAKTFLNHAPTPLPGAMLLAAPFYFIARIGFQNLFWTAAFLWMLSSYFSSRLLAAVFVAVFLGLAFENLQDFVTGGDYVTNIFYSSIAFFVFALALRKDSKPILVVGATVLLGVVISSRVIYILVLLPLFALAVQRTSLRRACTMMTGVLAVSALVTFPVFLPHPIANLLTQLRQNSDKFRYLPHWTSVVLPLFAMITGCVAFVIPMTLSRVYLLYGIISGIMLIRPCSRSLLRRAVSRGLSPQICNISRCQRSSSL